jgi:hypothetical protein
MKEHSATPPFDLLGQTAVIGGHNRNGQILYNEVSQWMTDKNLLLHYTTNFGDLQYFPSFR